MHSFEALERAKATGLFDVQSHTYSHALFRDVEYAPSPGTVAVIPASPPVALREELAATSDMIRRLLGHEVVGLRTPFGFYRGLRGRPDLLELLRENGIRYVSSWTRNEENGNPTPWVQPFAYEDEGYPDILEIPAQFWLDGIWFDAHGWQRRRGLPQGALPRSRRDRRAGPRLRRVLPRVGGALGGRGRHRLDRAASSRTRTSKASRSRPTRTTGAGDRG